MREENLHAGGKWETMNFLGVALLPTAALISAMCYIICEQACPLIAVPKKLETAEQVGWSVTRP